MANNLIMLLTTTHRLFILITHMKLCRSDLGGEYGGKTVKLWSFPNIDIGTSGLKKEISKISILLHTR